MRGAPPVRVVVRPGPKWQAFERVVWALAAASTTAWLCAHVALEQLPVLALSLVCALLAALAMRRLQRREPVSTLDWTGQDWRVGDREARPAVRLDLGPVLLLSVDMPGARRRWLPVDLRQDPAAAHLLRAALMAHAATRTAPEAGLGTHV